MNRKNYARYQKIRYMVDKRQQRFIVIGGMTFEKEEKQ